MDWAKKEVASLELSKKLKELGFPQNEPGWFWYANITNAIYRLIFLEEFNEKINKDMEDYIKAPTCPEMDKWLPLYLEKDTEKGIAFAVEVYGLHLHRTYDNKGWHISYGTLGRCAFTLPNAFAEMLIYLAKYGYIAFNQGDKDNAQSR